MNDILAGRIENQDMIVVHFVVILSGKPGFVSTMACDNAEKNRFHFTWLAECRRSAVSACNIGAYWN